MHEPFASAFFPWCNHEHHHDGFALLITLRLKDVGFSGPVHARDL
jgi:hypothetical protein